MILPFLLAPTVSFSAPAAPATRLLPDLGKRLGLSLVADGKLKAEVLLVDVANVTPSDLLNRIAQATGGEWEKKDDGYHLRLSGMTAAKERDAEAVERGRMWLKSNSSISTRTSRSAVRVGVGALAAVLASLPPETIGGLAYKERIVFSTQPTHTQRLLPADALRGVDLTHLAPVALPNVGSGPLSLPEAGPPTVVQLTLLCGGDGSQIFSTLAVADANGRVLGSETSQQSIPAEFFDGRPRPKPPVPDAVVTPSAEERALALALAGADPGHSNFYYGYDDESDVLAMYSPSDLSSPPVAPRYPELLRPEKVEPLGLVAGPLLARFAEGQGRNLVADLPDASFSPACALVAKGALKAQSLQATLQYDLGLTLVDEGGWMLLRPYRPAAARAARLDRAALGVALRGLAKERAMSLDARAAYAAAEPVVPARESFEAALFGAVDIDAGKTIAHSCASGERALLRLYGELGPGGRGSSKSFGSLPPDAQATLTELVYDAMSGPMRTLRYDTPTFHGSMSMGGNAYSVPFSLYGERTVFWPSGIPTNAVLSVKEESTPSFFGLAPNGVRPRVSENGGGYGMMSSGNGPTVVSTGLPSLERYTKGTFRTLTFLLTGEPSVSFQRTLHSNTIDANALAIPYADLPQSLRRRIEDNEANIRNSLSQNGRQPTNARP